MRILLLGIVAAAVLSATPLLAQDDDLFARLDANKDGSVTLDEVEGEGRAKIERLLRTSDKDGDKKLSKEEFAAGLKEADTPRQPLGQPVGRGRPADGNPRQFFERLDSNKDGMLSKEEAVGPIRENFARLDANSDGYIAEDEFARSRPGTLGAGNRPNARELDALFDRTDANSDGKLTKEEMPEDRRERFVQFLERLGVNSANKEQFARFVAIQQGGGRPGEGRPMPPGAPAGGRPLIAVLDADGNGELSASEIEAAGKALLTLDKNSDGKLTREELFQPSPDGPPPGRPGQRRLDQGRRNRDEILSRLKEADTSGDGKLNKDEVEKGQVPPALRENFARIDANSDGYLDESEIKAMVERFSEDRPDGRRPEGSRPDRPKRD
jgi:Ca2+-binding EF-hand superfamily protein